MRHLGMIGHWNPLAEKGGVMGITLVAVESKRTAKKKKSKE